MDPVFLTLQEVLDLHQESLARYGGAAGVRDMGLLQSALATPAPSFGGQFLHPDLPSMAAALAFSLVGNHPFVDGNKRTGAAAGRVFLLINGVRFDPPNRDFEELILGVASGQLDKDAAVGFFRQHSR